VNSFAWASVARAEQHLLAEHEHDQAGDHADAREAEAITPADRLAEIGDQDRAERGARVDAHVKDRVGRIAPQIGQAVELPDHHRNVRLKEPGADDDQRQGQPEHVYRRVVLPAVAFNDHGEMAERDQNPAEQHRLTLPQVAVGQVAAEHRGDVDQRSVSAVDQVRLAVPEQPVLG
jgi:hypothetical protein